MTMLPFNAIFNDLSWPFMTFYDLQWSFMTHQWPSNDLSMTFQWPFNDLSITFQWPFNVLSMPFNDLSWPFLTFLDLSWPFLTFLDLSWPFLTFLNLSWPFITLQWPFMTYLDLSRPFNDLSIIFRSIVRGVLPSLGRKKSFFSLFSTLLFLFGRVKKKRKGNNIVLQNVKTCHLSKRLTKRSCKGSGPIYIFTCI